MFYEEMMFHGVLHYRITPTGKWRKKTPEALTNELLEARRVINSFIAEKIDEPVPEDLVVYVPTKNGTGIQTTTLLVIGNKAVGRKITDATIITYEPPQDLSTLGVGDSEYLGNFYRTWNAAATVYINHHREIIKKSKDAIREVYSGFDDRE
jgi:hypothetical protein